MGLKIQVSLLSAVLISQMILLVTMVSYSGIAIDPLLQPISPPSQTKAYPQKDSITINWSEPDTGYLAATGFSLYKSDDGMDFMLLSSTDRDTFTYSDSDIIIGRLYHYFLRTDHDLGQSENGEIVSSAADSRSPYLEIISPSEGEVFGTPASTATWRAEDGGSGIFETRLILDDNTPISIESGNNFQFTDLEEGYHEVSVMVEDRAGNRAVDSTEFITDLSPPSLLISQPEEGSVHSSNDVIAIWDSVDDVSGIRSIELLMDNRPPREVAGKSSYDLRNLSDGEHTLTVVSSDMAGHDTTRSVNFTVDTEPPSLRIISPEEGSLISSGDVEIAWTGDDISTVITYRIRKNGKEWIPLGSVNEHVFRDMKEGIQIIEIEATDGAGWSEVADTSFTIDTKPPEFRILNEEHELRSFRGKLLIEWELSEENPGPFRVEWSLDGGSWKETERNERLILENLDDGIHILGLRTVDRAGNEGTTSCSTLWDSTPPVLISHTPNGTLNKKPDFIELVFSEEISRGTLSVSGNHPELYVRESGRTAVIDISGELDHGMSYTFILRGEDGSGNSLEDGTIHFEITDMAEISGRVVDGNGKGFPHVTVTLDTGRITTTGSDGKFSVMERMGNITIHFTRDGYRKAEIEIYATPEKQNWAGTVKLEKDDGSGMKSSGVWITDPVNLALSACLLISVIIISALLWRYFDRERYDEVDIEMDDDT